MSQLIHAWIDDESYLLLKTKKINISKTVRNLLNNYLELQQTTPEDEEVLIQDINRLKEERAKVNEDLSQKSVQLSLLQEKRSKAEANRLQEVEAFDQTNKERGVLHDF